MISLLVELVLVVGISVLAHAAIAYVLAPRRARDAILSALSSDAEFQGILIQSVIKNLMNPIVQDGKTILPIDPIISRALEAFRSYVQEQQKVIEQSASEYADAALADPENPMLAMVLSQIPKKYRWLLPFVGQFMRKG